MTQELVTDVIAESAFTQIVRLRKDMTGATEDLIAFSKAGKDAFKGITASNSLIELVNGLKAASDANKGAIIAQQQYNSTVEKAGAVMSVFGKEAKQYADILKRLEAIETEAARNRTEASKQATEAAKANTEVTKQNANATLAAAKASTEAAKQKEIETRYTILLTKEKERLDKSLEKEKVSAALAENQYVKLRKEYNLQSTELKGMIIQYGLADAAVIKMRAEVDKMYKSLLMAEKAVGQHQRQVGQYENATMALSQLIREAPAFANSVQTGLSALSNNFPILFDQFKKLREEVGSTGKALKILGASMFGFTNLFILAYAAIEIFGKNLFKTKNEVDEYKKSLEELDKQAVETATKEQAHVAVLLEVAKNTKEAMDIRLRAVDELQKAYPDYLGNLSKEALLTGNVREEVEKLNEALFNKALMQAAESKVALAAKKYLDDVIELKKAQDQLNASIASYNRLKGVQSFAGDEIGQNPEENAKKQVDLAQKAVDNIRKSMADAKKEATDFLNQAKDFALKAGSLALPAKREKNGASIVEGLNSLFEAYKRHEQAIADLAKQRYELSAANNKKIWEDDEKTLEERLTAYKNYEDALKMLASTEAARELATITDKVRILNEKERLYREGKIKLTKYQYEVLHIDQDTYAKEWIAQTEHLQAALAEIEANGVLTIAGIRNKARAQERQREKDYETAEMQGLEDRLADFQDMYNKESMVIAQNYLDKKINEKQFQEQIRRLKNQYAITELQEKIAQDEYLLNSGKITDAKEIERLKHRLNAEKKALTDAKVDGVGGDGVDKKRVNDAYKQAVQQGVDESINLTQTLMDSYYQRLLDNEQKLLDAIETRKNAQIAAVDDLMLSEDKKAKKIKEINAQAAQQEKIIQDEMRRIKHQQAIADRVAAVLRIVENTAIAVTSALSIPGAGIGLAAANAAIGAAQIAAVLAQPLPAYRHGTPKDGVGHPGGPALVGEDNRPELVIEPGKAPYIIDSPTVTNLARHTRVIPEAELLANNVSLMTPKLMAGLTVNNDFSKLEAATNRGFAQLEDTIKNKREVFVNVNNAGIMLVHKIGNSYINLINDHNS